MPEVSTPTLQVASTSGPKNANTCMGCGLFIKDQFIFKVLPDMQWHESCLKCAECDCKLQENSTCFVKNGKAYCKTDYTRLFMIKCNRCGDNINRNDLIMKSRSKIYHFECFCCNVCNKKLLPGDEYQIREEQLYCKEDAVVNLNSNFQSTNTQLYLSNLNGYNSSTMAITPEHSVSSSSYSPSTNSSSSSVVDSPNNLSNYTSLSNNSFNYTNSHITASHFNSYQSFIDGNNSNNNHNRSEYDYNDKEDDASISSDDDLDNDDDDNDNSISEESSLNESVNSNGIKSKNKKNNGKLGSNRSSFHSSYSTSSLLKVHGSSSGHKPARIRTVLNEKQLHTLRACYGANPRPDALMKEQLVEMTGLNPRVIRVWFQNKRCKDKKKNMLVRPDQVSQHQHQMQLPNNPYNGHPMPNIPGQHNIMFDNCY